MSRVERAERLERRFYQRLTLFRAVNVIIAFVILLTLGAALLEWLIEPQTFGSFGDACWWAVTTVSTTGYGDVVPQTVAGKVVAAFVMVTALAWVPAVTAIVTTMHIRRHDERRRTVPSSTVTHLTRFDEIIERLDRVELRLAAATLPAAGAAGSPTLDTRRAVPPHGAAEPAAVAELHVAAAGGLDSIERRSFDRKSA